MHGEVRVLPAQNSNEVDLEGLDGLISNVLVVIVGENQLMGPYRLDYVLFVFFGFIIQYLMLEYYEELQVHLIKRIIIICYQHHNYHLTTFTSSSSLYHLLV